MLLFKKSQKLFLDELKSKIKKAKVVSFDIFDTLLIRPYIKPTDLFLHLEKSFNCNGFALERRDAERRCRIRHRELEDITFDMIYDEIDEEFKHLKQKEMDWEEMVLRPNPELKQVYDYALKLNKKIIIVSDMYMPSDFLAKVLRKNGFDGFEKLYVSAEIGKKKGSGTLFKYILEELKNYKPKDILHIGDNKISDFEMPKNIGFKTALYEQVFEQFLKNDKRARIFNEQNWDNFSSSILLSVFAHNWQKERCAVTKKKNYWENIGYRYTAPLAYGYSRFIEKQAKKDNINHLLFVARDGYTLEKIFKTFNSKIKTSYVYAPRIISMMCSGKLNYESPNYGIEVVVEKMAEVSDELKKLLGQAKPITRNEYKIFYDKNKELILNIAKENQQKYRKYLDKFINKKDNIALIDLYTTYFSSQTLFENILNKSIPAYYFVIYPKALNLFKDLKYSYFSQTFENDISKYTWTNTELFTNFWFFVEFLITSPEPSIKDISFDGEPIFNEVDKEEIERSKLYTKIANSSIEFANDVKDLYGGNDVFIQYEIITKWINCFIDNYNDNDCQKFNKFSWCVSPTNTSRPILLFNRNFSLFDMIFKSKKTKEEIEKLRWKTKFQKKYLKLWGIYKEITPSIEIKRFFGLTLYKKRIEPNETRISKCLGLLKIKETKEKEKIYFCGVKISDKEKSLKISDLKKILSETNRQMVNEITKKIQRSITIALLHQKTFAEFRNKHNNQIATLIGAGPSVKFFETIKDSIYIGLNRAFLLDKVKFDYLFSIDKMSLKNDNENFYEAFTEYDCEKFIGDQNIGIDFQMPQSFVYSDNKIRRYKTSAMHINSVFPLEIDSEPLLNSTSVAIQAMQFILFTNPKKVYIVGIDCTLASKQHFAGSSWDVSKRNENAKRNDEIHVQDWNRIKTFVQTYYPETEIISINPVGLKGIFRDVYTKSYLQKHPEIDPETVEIFEQEEEICV